MPVRILPNKNPLQPDKVGLTGLEGIFIVTSSNLTVLDIFF